ncbi:MAG TPA: hypothetical protein VF576_00965 [Rubricoccaceae bacterium]|jgi:hypothetical protein
MFASALALALLLVPTDTTSAQETTSPAAAQLMEAVQTYVEPFDDTDENVQIRTEWADLTGDGVDDALVYLESLSWCGSGGCTVLVFEAITGEEAVAELGAFRPAAEISLMQGPVVVAPTRHEGWADLVVQDADGARVALQFDGETYPSSPAAGVAVGASPAGTVLFADAE